MLTTILQILLVYWAIYGPVYMYSKGYKKGLAEGQATIDMLRMRGNTC